MKIFSLCFLSFIILVLPSCTSISPTIAMRPSPRENLPQELEQNSEKVEEEEAQPKTKKTFVKKIDVEIPLTIGEESGFVNASVYRPSIKQSPKTLVIIVPGSGNISREGEIIGDGIESYENNLLLSELWAQALSSQGYFVLSYDKRTCTKAINKLCQTNPQSDIEQEGIVALARDLDQVFNFAQEKFVKKSDENRVIFLSSTQGAQVLALAKSAKDVDAMVLLSPIFGGLEEMWVGGLGLALERTHNQAKKTQLANQKESMSGFFTSFKAGHFPDHAHIKGASVQFWRSWLKASQETTDSIIKSETPSLFLVSQKDVFAEAGLSLAIKQKIQKAEHIQMSFISDSDRNFIINGELDPKALESVRSFFENLPKKSKTN